LAWCEGGGGRVGSGEGKKGRKERGAVYSLAKRTTRLRTWGRDAGSMGVLNGKYYTNPLVFFRGFISWAILCKFILFLSFSVYFFCFATALLYLFISF
jgi:hypothetical protein